MWHEKQKCIKSSPPPWSSPTSKKVNQYIPERKQACSATNWEPSENSQEGIKFTGEDEETVAVAEKQT